MKEFAKDIGTLQKQQKQATINSNQMKLDTLWAYLKKVSWHLHIGNLTVNIKSSRLLFLILNTSKNFLDISNYGFILIALNSTFSLTICLKEFTVKLYWHLYIIYYKYNNENTNDLSLKKWTTPNGIAGTTNSPRRKPQFPRMDKMPAIREKDGWMFLPNRDSLWPRKFHGRIISLEQSSIITKLSKHAHPNGQFYTYCVLCFCTICRYLGIWKMY